MVGSTNGGGGGGVDSRHGRGPILTGCGTAQGVGLWVALILRKRKKHLTWEIEGFQMF